MANAIGWVLLLLSLYTCARVSGGDGLDDCSGRWLFDWKVEKGGVD
ncbi:hypothetical protein [Caldanaerobius polysaccharolyticus]|nr:hypothetical protein [Caldanaerobius polysaccharolyticus]